MAIVSSVNVGAPQEWAPNKPQTGIKKTAVAHIDVFAPGEREDGGRSGVVGDFVGDGKHHGGTEQAVYAVAEEELEFWRNELGKPLAPGAFGENLTTRGLDVDDARIGSIWRIGSAVLEVTGPRIPCRTFAWAIDEPRWVKRFTDHRRCGAYLKVLEPGRITTNDDIQVDASSAAEITVTDVFAAYSGNRAILADVVAAEALAPRYQRELQARMR